MVLIFILETIKNKYAPQKISCPGITKNANRPHVLFTWVFGASTTCVEMTHVICRAPKSEHSDNDRPRRVLSLKKYNLFIYVASSYSATVIITLALRQGYSLCSLVRQEARLSYGQFRSCFLDCYRCK